jgi:hypothetical protein
MIWGGLGLAVFFLAIQQFFRLSAILIALGLLGTVFGVVAGLCFAGIGLTPANLQPMWHQYFVLTAFRAFLVAVVLHTIAIFLSPAYPRRYGWVYVGFAVLLSAYIGLLTEGPSMDTMRGVIFQAVGQKIIVYAAVTCVIVQAWGALRRKAMNEER